MDYISTRGLAPRVSGRQAVLTGLAPDGGLYVPAEPLAPLAPQGSYAATMEAILGRFFDDTPESVRHEAVTRSVARFAAPDVTPLRACGDDAVFLELFHGPTAAFKDVALTILPHLMRDAALAAGIERVCVLTATSGDTGSAAMEGFADVPGTAVLTFYPQTGTSEIQRRQMVCCAGSNVTACAIEGNFDDAQAAVKAAFADPTLAAEAAASKALLSSANSINIGRLFPQICYYLETAGRLGRPFDVVVPTGNFGNILAAWYARLLGAPIERFAVASNVNRVVCDFVRGGVYDARRDFAVTNSPSMDILVSSNVERLLSLLTDGNAEAVRGWEAQLASDRRFELTPGATTRLKQHFRAGWATPEETETAIREVWERHHYLVDPHTAIGWKVARELGLRNPVIAATASPWKFPRTMLRAITGRVVGNDFRAAEELAALTGATPVLTGLEQAPERHRRVTSRAAVPDTVRAVFGF